MLRISATEVEAYRLFVCERWMTKDRFLGQLVGESEDTVQMRAGTAWHEFLETTESWVGDEVLTKEFAFILEFDGELAIGPVREVKTERQYLIDGMDVTLVGKADVLHGQRVSDHKLTEEFSAEWYSDSLQWRVYMMLFGANTFTYNCFEGHEVVLKGRQRRKDRRIPWEITGLHQFSVHRYLGMEDDVLRYLHGLVQFIRTFAPQRIDHPSVFERQLPF